MRASLLELERLCTAKHKGMLLQAGSKVLLQKSKFSPEIFTHQLHADLPVQHLDGHFVFHVLLPLN